MNKCDVLDNCDSTLQLPWVLCIASVSFSALFWFSGLQLYRFGSFSSFSLIFCCSRRLFSARELWKTHSALPDVLQRADKSRWRTQGFDFKFFKRSSFKPSNWTDSLFSFTSVLINLKTLLGKFEKKQEIPHLDHKASEHYYKCEWWLIGKPTGGVQQDSF